MSGKKGPEPEPEPEPSSTHSALDHVEAHAETRADEHSRLVSKASADVSSIGLGSMEAQMAAARAEMEEQIRKEEEEKEARRKGKRVGGGRRKREERKEGVPLTAPSLSGRPRSRPGSASKSPRLPPLQHVPQQPGAEDRAAAAAELRRRHRVIARLPQLGEEDSSFADTLDADPQREEQQEQLQQRKRARSQRGSAAARATRSPST